MSIFAVDFGGTRIKAGVIQDGKVLAQDVIAYKSGTSLAQSIQHVKKLCERLIVSTKTSADAMVCALPCIVSPDRSKVTRTFGKYDDAPNFDLNAWTQAEMGIPCLLENDARAAAIGEWQYGAGKGVENLAMITLGTGIGTAVICDGRPLFGKHGVAGNLCGHNTVHMNGRQCVCGLRGCVEAHAATWALPGIARESDLFSNSRLSSADVIDYRIVFAEAAQHDQLACELRDNAINCWTNLVMNLIYQYDPECVVLGGGIMAGKDIILPAIQLKLDIRIPELHRKTKILAAELGDVAALAGGWKVFKP
ncbi:MAG TPA: ROK family protein [Verrucomicrobiales bacterium]|nr:ROK family protein [Verrucomicrobiales bacterium]